MEEELRYFVAYLENIRKASHNTVMSYHSDLTKMIAYLMDREWILCLRCGPRI